MTYRIDTEFDLNGFIGSKIGGRDENQDSAGAVETKLGTIIVVCDGMGGAQGGKTASMLAVQTIIDDVANADQHADPKAILIAAIQHANAEIIQAGIKAPELAGMGTTVTAVLINENCATAVHVGDSRIYQFRNGEKVFRTFDHSLVFQRVLAGKMTEEQARTASNSNVILKALGIYPDLQFDVVELPYLAGDRFMLCTDGVWGTMPEKELIQRICARAYLKEVVDDNLNEIDEMGVKAGGGHDNLTAAVFDVMCNSKMDVKMSKKHKLYFSILCALLVLSLGCNIYALKWINQSNPSAEPEIEVVETELENGVEHLQDPLFDMGNTREGEQAAEADAEEE